MLLRRFYIQENEKAQEPKQKKTRELKTDIIPLEIANKELIEEMERRKKDSMEKKTGKREGETEKVRPNAKVDSGTSGNHGHAENDEKMEDVDKAGATLSPVVAEIGAGTFKKA
jgi:hypothetical protein